MGAHGRTRRSVSPRPTRSRSPGTTRGSRQRSRSRDGGRSHRRRHRSRSRSRDAKDKEDSRSRHGGHRGHRSRSERPSSSQKVVSAVKELPFEARPLSKREFRTFTPLLAYYLDLQKQRDLYAMDEREARGRWKSFLGKWNRGELAEGWYDPAMYDRSKELYPDEAEFEGSEGSVPAGTGSIARSSEVSERARSGHSRRAPEPLSEEDLSEDDVGPLPAPRTRQNNTTHGATIPTIEDLSERNAQISADRQASYEALRSLRKSDRTEQKERLEELVPRADPGSHARKLEKKAEIREKLRPASPGGDHEVDDGALMGGGDSMAEFKKERELQARKKSEREKRRDEIWRAREEERLERVRAYKEKEEATVAMLRQFAKRQAGGGQ